MKDRLLRAAESGSITAEQFRSVVRAYLRQALVDVEKITAAPADVMDIAHDPLMQTLTAMDEFIYAIGRDVRRQEDQEDTRERQVKAKRRDPSLERSVMLVDERVQQLVEVLGVDGPGWALQPMAVHGLLDAVVRLFGAMPDEAFTGFVPPGTIAHDEPRVLAMKSAYAEHTRAMR